MTTFIQDNIATILLNEEVTMDNSKEIVDFIYGASFLNEVDTIKVSINSPGGSVIGGMNIFTALVSSEKKVVTHIDGIAASIAAVIFMAGQERSMMEYALFMIHNPFGTSDEKSLSKIKESLMKMLGEDNFKNLSTLMDEETWFNADEMKGLINKVIEVENGNMKSITNKAFELFEVVNKLKKEEMEELKNQKPSIENETLESSLEERVETLDEALEPTEEVEEITSEVKDEEIKEEISEEVSEEIIAEENKEVEEEDSKEDLDVEAELTEEIAETEAETEIVAEEVKEEVVAEELELVENVAEEVVNVVELSNKLKEQEELISELTNKLSIYEKETEHKAKLSVLENSSINESDYANWLELDISTIEKLSGTVNKVSPSFDEEKKDLVFSELSNEMKENLKENEPERYSKLFFENK